MSTAHPEWLKQGTGLAPRVAWSFGTDAELAGMEMARESGEIIAFDVSGGVYRLNRQGQIQSVSRGLHKVQFIRWCDTGDAGLVVADKQRFSIVDRDLNVVWTSTAHGRFWPVPSMPTGTTSLSLWTTAILFCSASTRRKSGSSARSGRSSSWNSPPEPRV